MHQHDAKTQAKCLKHRLRNKNLEHISHQYQMYKMQTQKNARFETLNRKTQSKNTKNTSFSWPCYAFVSPWWPVTYSHNSSCPWHASPFEHDGWWWWTTDDSLVLLRRLPYDMNIWQDSSSWLVQASNMQKISNGSWNDMKTISTYSEKTMLISLLFGVQVNCWQCVLCHPGVQADAVNSRRVQAL